MGFEVTVARNAPLTEVEDADAALEQFLALIGYLPKGYGPKTGASDVRDSVPYRLFVDCFLRRPDRGWTIEELIAVLDTSRPTVYRHLNKLKALDVLEEEERRPEEGGQTKKVYRLRYGNLSKAWNFVEAHVAKAMESYRETVDHVHDLLQREGKTHEG